MSFQRNQAEDGVNIKPEHEADEFEDTGECQMPRSEEEQQAWLCRLPKWLWTAWADIADDEEIEIGKVRVYHQPNADGSQKIQMKLHDLPSTRMCQTLRPDQLARPVQQHRRLLERDQPGFKAWNPNRVRKDTRGMNYKVNKNKPYTSSIPSTLTLNLPRSREPADSYRSNRSRRLRQG